MSEIYIAQYHWHISIALMSHVTMSQRMQTLKEFVAKNLAQKHLRNHWIAERYNWQLQDCRTQNSLTTCTTSSISQTKDHLYPRGTSGRVKGHLSVWSMQHFGNFAILLEWKKLHLPELSSDQLCSEAAQAPTQIHARRYSHRRCIEWSPELVNIPASSVRDAQQPSHWIPAKYHTTAKYMTMTYFKTQPLQTSPITPLWTGHAFIIPNITLGYAVM